MRRLKLTTLLVLPLAFALTLGAAPRDAEAGLCKKQGFKNGCVTSRDAKNDNLKAKDLKDEAGVEFVGVANSALTTTAAAVQMVTITAPTAGFVIVSGHGSFQFVVADNGFCDLTSGASLNNTAGIVGTGNNSFSPFALTKAFAVSAGSNTFNLVCNSGANGTTNMIRAGMTAIFFPTRY